MTIFKLNLSNLVNSDHVNFMKFTVTAISLFDYVNEKFTTAVANFTAKYDQENDAYLKRNRSFITKQVQRAHEERIKRFRSLSNQLKGIADCPEQEKIDAAEFLIGIIDDYGGASKIQGMRVDSISGIFTNLAEDFQDKYAEKVETVGLTHCVEDLKQANDEYIRLRSNRTMEVSEQEKAEMRDARNECDTAWRALIDLVNIEYYLNKDEQLLPFMRYMNTEIDWYRTILKQKPGNADTDFDGGEEEEEKPEPTKVTAMFHFADHTEEEVQQVAGSALTAPENTEGYHWEPEVPEVMPAKDTAYYEMENQNEEEEDERPKYKITFRAGGSLVAIKEYHEGETIVPPDCPEGFRWPDDMPTVMPAQNVTVRAEGLDD